MKLRAEPKIIESIEVESFFTKFNGHLKLSIIAGEKGLKKVIREKSINRPGIALSGFLKFFANDRIQLFGAGEMAYMETLSQDEQQDILLKFAKLDIPCIIVSRDLKPTPIMIEVANRFEISLFCSPLSSKHIITSATVLLEYEFAPTVAEHGTMLDIKGIGTLLRGKSGIGKSECALALIERGHSLVADDLTYIKLINEKELLASSAKLNRGYMECRGIGIIDVGELFGIKNVRLEKRVDLVVSFNECSPDHDEERTGLEESYYPILGVEVPYIEICIRPGRDLARLVEVAALVRASKIMGHDSAREFNERLIAHMTNQGGA